MIALATLPVTTVEMEELPSILRSLMTEIALLPFFAAFAMRLLLLPKQRIPQAPMTVIAPHRLFVLLAVR